MRAEGRKWGGHDLITDKNAGADSRIRHERRLLVWDFESLVCFYRSDIDREDKKKYTHTQFYCIHIGNKDKQILWTIGSCRLRSLSVVLFGRDKLWNKSDCIKQFSITFAAVISKLVRLGYNNSSRHREALFTGFNNDFFFLFSLCLNSIGLNHRVI